MRECVNTFGKPCLTKCREYDCFGYLSTANQFEVGARSAAPVAEFPGAPEYTRGVMPDPFDAPVPAPVGASLGTRVLGYVVAAVLGLLFGVLGTVVYSISFSVFGLFDVPIGLIVALPAVGLLLVGLRLIAPGRLAALLAGIALIGVVALLALPSPGGSVLIPDGTAGMVWLIGSTLVAVVVLAWPRLGAAPRGARPTPPAGHAGAGIRTP